MSNFQLKNVERPRTNPVFTLPTLLQDSLETVYKLFLSAQEKKHFASQLKGQRLTEG